jgi:hypothetical protein
MSAGSISQWEKKGAKTIGMQSRTLAVLQKTWKLTVRGR